MLTIKLDTKDLQTSIERAQGFSKRRLNAAIATAITRTAKAAHGAVKAEMMQAIDRPTPYTQRQLRYTTASANNLVAAVGFNIAPIQDVYGNVVRYQDLGKGQTPAGKYLTPQIEGGPRAQKRFEKALQAAGAMPAGWYAVPGPGAKIDQYGNVSSGQIKQILSQVGTELTAGYNRTMSQDKAKKPRALGRAGGQYVAVPKQRGKMKPGIYIATGQDFGRKWGFGRTGKLIPVFFFTRSVRYTVRYRFYARAQQLVDSMLPLETVRAIEESAMRLAAKQG